MKNLLLVLLFLPLIGFGQCVSGDCENGYGIYTWDNGEKYVGEWKREENQLIMIIIYLVFPRTEVNSSIEQI